MGFWPYIWKAFLTPCLAYTATHCNTNTHLRLCHPCLQTVSGATLQLSPGAGGMFALVINGTPPQVEAARSLVATVVGGQI